MQVMTIRPFIPSKDLEVSKAFYKEIGFISEDVSDELTLFQNGHCQFFLQRFYNQQLAENFMLQMCVSNIEAAFEVCSSSVHKTKISAIQQQPWGKVFYLWGPVGELLHITELAV